MRQSVQSTLKEILKRLGLHKPGRFLYNTIFLSRSTRQSELAGASCVFKTPTNTLAEYVESFSEEREVLEDFLTSIRPNDVVWDVGANFGLYTIYSGKKLSAGGQVLAFEPEPKSLDLLRKNISLNQLTNIQIFAIALGAEAGDTEIYQSDCPNLGTSALRQRDDFKLKKRGKKIQIRRGDDLVTNGMASAPNILKIDVEGAEMGVLKGMGDILKSNNLRHLFIEVHPLLLPSFNCTPEIVEEVIAQSGFKIAKRIHRGTEYHLICTRS